MNHNWGWANGGKSLWNSSCNGNACNGHFGGRIGGIVVRRWRVGFDLGMACTSMRWGSSSMVCPSLRSCYMVEGHMAGVLARHCDEVTKDDLRKELNSR